MPVGASRHTLVHARCDPLEDALEAGVEVVEVERRGVEEEILLGGSLALRLHSPLDALHHALDLG